MTEQPTDVIDTPKKLGWGKRFGLVFGNAAPHGGFAKLVLILALLVGLSVIYFYRGGEDEAVLPASKGLTDRDNKEETVPTAVAKEEITRDRKSATEVRSEGGTFVGTRPNTGKKSIDEVLAGINAEEEPSPAPPPPEVKAVSPVFKSNLDLSNAQRVTSPRVESKRQGGNVNKETGQFIKDRISALRQTATGTFSNGTLVQYDPQVELEKEEAGRRPDSDEAKKTQAQIPVTSSDESDEFLAQRAGYFSYAHTIVGVDTDVPVNDIVVEIMGGQLDGARAMGSWKRLGNFYEQLALTFNSLEYEGEVYSVNMIGFNTTTHLPAFVSEVDRHILYRWGGLLTGAALEAAQAAALAAAAISNPEATDSVVQATSTLSGEDIRNLFLSEGGSRIADQLKDNFQRPITSRVFVGEDMRLLSLEPIYVKSKGSL